MLPESEIPISKIIYFKVSSTEMCDVSDEKASNRPKKVSAIRIRNLKRNLDAESNPAKRNGCLFRGATVPFRAVRRVEFRLGSSPVNRFYLTGTQAWLRRKSAHDWRNRPRNSLATKVWYARNGTLVRGSRAIISAARESKCEK